MRDFAARIISGAAQANGLDPSRIIDLVKKDNLTLERPRLELQFLPETYTRTGRTLAFTRTGTHLLRKRELYEVQMSVAANVLAEDKSWLSSFCYGFVASLPSGANDARGNWVKIRAEKATFSRPADKRVGDEVIEVFSKVNQLFDLAFTWRVTSEEIQALIPSFTINVNMGKV